MATALATQGSRMKWHVRGLWDAREDRVPSAIWLGILWVGMVAGFGVDLPGFVRRNPPPPRVMWVHGAVFTVWMLLLTAQVTLVLRDRTAWHRKLGWFSAGWACLMAVMGPVGVFATLTYYVKVYGPFPYPPFALHVVDLGGFLVLLAWGIALRKNPAAHKRMMILATIALADPGFSRFSGFFMKEPTSVVPWFFYMFYGNVLLIVLMLGWDWWRRRLLRSFVLASAGLVATLCVVSFLWFWGPWKALTLDWVQTLARHVI